jgi:hypothetical protein
MILETPGKFLIFSPDLLLLITLCRKTDEEEDNKRPFLKARNTVSVFPKIVYGIPKNLTLPVRDSISLSPVADLMVFNRLLKL